MLDHEKLLGSLLEYLEEAAEELADISNIRQLVNEGRMVEAYRLCHTALMEILTVDREDLLSANAGLTGLALADKLLYILAWPRV